MPKGIPRTTPCERGHPWVRENRTPGNHCLACSLLFPRKKGRPAGPMGGCCKRGHPRTQENRLPSGGCRPCQKVRKAAYRKANPDKFRKAKNAQKRRRRDRDPEQYYAARQRQAERKRRRRWARIHPGQTWQPPPKRQSREEHIREYLLVHPCIDCGEPDPVVLEFDHRVPADRTCSVHRCNSFFAREKEIAKCDVRCCNCHTRRHYYENLAARMSKKMSLTPASDRAILRIS